MLEMRLVADGLTLSRGGRLVLADLGFAVAPGQALLLRGPNGVGKSSALMVLAGLLAPQAGTLAFPGSDPEARPFSHIHYVGHDPAIKTGMSLRENLKFWVEVLGGSSEAIGPALAMAGLGKLDALDAGLLSAGQTRRLALARLLAVPRPVWLLDEPTSALDSQGSAWVGEIISDHIGQGGLAVIATHLDIPIAGDVRVLEFSGAAA